MKTSTKDKLLRLAKTGAKAALNVISPAASVASKLVTSNVGKKVVKESLQGQARTYAGAAEGLQRVGAGVVKRATGVELPVQTLTPTGKVQKAIFGTDKPITARSVGEEVPFVKKGSKIAPAVGVLMGTLDALPGGKGITTALKNANKVDDVVRILKGGTKFADDVITDIAPKIAQTTDENAIKTILSQAQQVVKTTGTKERGFITSVKNKFPQMAGKVAGQYVPRDTDTLAIKARSLVRLNPEEAIRKALSDVSDEGVATASELIKHFNEQAAKTTDLAQQNALYDKAAQIANEVAQTLTEAGRSVQAASILGRMTPAGQIRFAARTIQKYNEQLAKKGSVFGLKKPLQELSGEQVKKITDEMEAIQLLDDGEEKLMRFRELQQYVQSLVPTPLMKKIASVWKAGLLTGVKTSGLNIFSNLTHGIAEVAKDIPAAIVDTGVSLFTGKRSSGLTFNRAAEGAAEGFGKGLKYLKTGFDERNIGAKLDYHKINFGKGKVAKAFQAYTDTVFRIIGAEDQPFYYGALRRSLYDQAKISAKNAGLKGDAAASHIKMLLENPTPDMLKYGTLDATTAVFQNSTKLGEWGTKLQNIGPFEFVVPFVRTPSAVAMQIINYSPVGAVKTVVEQIIKGKFDQRLFSQGIGRSITGTGALWAGYELFDKGLVSLDTPRTEGEKKLWEAEGRTKNSIKIGDKWRSVQVLGPFGQLLLLGAHFKNNLNETGSPVEALAKATGGAMKSFSEQTFLQGVSQIVEAANDPERYLTSYVSQLVSSAIPTLASDIARATDPFERRREGVAEAVISRVPGARQTLEPQVTILGEERESAGNPLEIMFDPTRPSKINETPVTSELRRLSDAGFPASPTQLGDLQGFDILSKEENTALWKRAGELTNSKLENLFASPEYQQLDDSDKKKIVERFTSFAGNVARAEKVIEMTDGLQGDALTQKLKELKEAKFYTQDVYRVLKEIR